MWTHRSNQLPKFTYRPGPNRKERKSSSAKNMSVRGIYHQITSSLFMNKGLYFLIGPEWTIWSIIHLRIKICLCGENMNNSHLFEFKSSNNCEKNYSIQQNIQWKINWAEIFDQHFEPKWRKVCELHPGPRYHSF